MYLMLKKLYGFLQKKWNHYSIKTLIQQLNILIKQHIFECVAFCIRLKIIYKKL